MKIAKMAPSLQMNGLRKCSIYIQWNFTQPRKMSFAGKMDKTAEHHLK
jgi:hypothetical protein